MNERFLSIDLGSKNLKICLTEVDKTGEINLLTSIDKEISSFKNGEIIEEEVFASEVINFIEEFSGQFKSKDLKTILSFSSSTFNFQKIKTKTLVEGRVISEEEIKKCKSLARASLISSSLEIIYEEPGKFFLDNYPTPIRNPLGLEARQLEVELNIIQIFKPYFLKLQENFSFHHLPLKAFYPNPLGAANIILDQKAKEEGCLVIDWGYKTLSCLSFYEGTLNNFIVFNLGLEDIWAPIFNEFGIDETTFKIILNEFQGSTSLKQTFKVKKQKISFNQFIKTLEKRINLLFKKTNFFEFLEKEKKVNPLLSGVFLIGGIIYFPEIESILKKIIKMKVQKGFDLKERLKNLEELKYLNALGNVHLYLKMASAKSWLTEVADYFKKFFSNLLPF